MTKNQKPGFTIIEVVLVLAIAGLIFLMVFVALPALQRTQRDTQRKQDVSRLNSALENYKSNNNGKYPWSDLSFASNSLRDVSSEVDLESFLNSYMKKDEGEFIDPSGNDYNIRVLYWENNHSNSYGLSVPAPRAGNINIIAGADCRDEGRVWSNGRGGVKKNGERVTNTYFYVIQYGLEVGGRVCVEGN